MGFSFFVTMKQVLCFIGFLFFVFHSVQADECRVTGCNGEICAEFEVSTTCGVTQDWGQCYLLSECTRLENGQCGWTATEIFTRCLYRNGCECSEENDSRTCPGTDFEYGNICFPNGAATECAIQPVRCPEYDDDDCML